MKKLADMSNGDSIEGQFLIASCTRCEGSKGNTYLNISLQDNSGTMDARKWNSRPEDEEIFVPGTVVSISADVFTYRDVLQMKIQDARPLDQNLIDHSAFATACPVDVNELKTKLKNYIDSIKIPEAKELVSFLIEENYDSFVTYPAATKNHHNCMSGLLFHTISMVDLAEQVCLLYPELNRDILISGALIHDIGKIKELSGPEATQYTLEGKLLAHISIGQAMVKEAADALNLKGEVPLLLEHMIIAHHGKSDFGSPVPPKTREALALSMIDDFDAKMNILSKAYDGVAAGNWTQKIYAMDNGYFYCPEYSEKKDA